MQAIASTTFSTVIRSQLGLWIAQVEPCEGVFESDEGDRVSIRCRGGWAVVGCVSDCERPAGGDMGGDGKSNVHGCCDLCVF